jgi:uncharacterized membrane protein YdjX (TVP38/TMEM64 family)
MYRLVLLTFAVSVLSLAVFFISPLEIKAFIDSIGTLPPLILAATFVVSFVVYSAVFAFMLPIGALLLIAFGYMFGFPASFFLCMAGAAFGAYSLFHYSRKKMRKVCHYFLGDRYDHIVEFARTEPMTYLLTTRFAPVVPFLLAHVIPAQAGVSTRLFLLTTLAGVVLPTLVFTYVGSTLKNVTSIDQLLSGELLFGLSLIPFMVFITVILRFVLHKRKLIKPHHVHFSLKKSPLP